MVIGLSAHGDSCRRSYLKTTKTAESKAFFFGVEPGVRQTQMESITTHNTQQLQRFHIVRDFMAFNTQAPAR